MKYNDSYFNFMFNRVSRSDPFPNLAAFRSLNKNEGDLLTVEYMQVLRAHWQHIKNREKRRRGQRNEWSERNHPFKRKAYASRSLD